LTDDYKRLNLRDDVENFAERFGLAETMEIRFGRSALGVQGGGFSFQKLAPNLPGSSGHRHRTQEEVYLVIAGSGRMKLDDDVLDLRRWDVVRVPPGVARGFASGPDGLELIAIGFGEGGDGEIVEGFWEAGDT
jgi:mannose-6-phosphate isomerase-like protein (cupin superfamily)